MKASIKKEKIGIIFEALDNGITTYKACGIADVNNATFWKWRQLDKELDKAYDDAITTRNEIVADALYTNAIKGNVAAQIFWMKARAGWVENQPQVLSDFDIPDSLQGELITDAADRIRKTSNKKTRA